MLYLREHHIDPLVVTRRPFAFIWSQPCSYAIPVLSIAVIAWITHLHS